MKVSKSAYFYFKVEDEPYAEYKNGWHEWYMEYFCKEVHVSDNGGNDIIAEPGTVYLVPPHTYMYFNYKNTNTFTHTAWIFKADDNFMNSLAIPYRTPVAIKNIADFELLLYEMQQRQISTSQFSQMQQDAYLMLILSFIHDEIYPFENDFHIKKGDNLQDIRNTVMNSLAIHWTVSSMAERAHMSASTFQRQYKKLYGKTPIADLYDMRFVKAKRLLETGYSIPYILHSCCFKSLQHFSSFFKKRTGITPSEYKTQAEKK